MSALHEIVFALAVVALVFAAIGYAARDVETPAQAGDDAQKQFRVVCTRAYLDGAKVETIARDQEFVDAWLEFYQGGSVALFVGPDCVQRGLLSAERCAEISAEIRTGGTA